MCLIFEAHKTREKFKLGEEAIFGETFASNELASCYEQLALAKRPSSVSWRKTPPINESVYGIVASTLNNNTDVFEVILYSQNGFLKCIKIAFHDNKSILVLQCVDKSFDQLAGGHRRDPYILHTRPLTFLLSFLLRRREPCREPYIDTEAICR